MTATTQNKAARLAERAVERELDSILDAAREIRQGLERLEKEAALISARGIDAPRFACSIGGGSMNVDVRKFAELDAGVRTINALRDVLAHSAEEGS